ncbi:SDR family oxidoreductase [Streptomyces sp. NPDC048018]|uniref:SDR family oxidoreductase n=1 Tax=Streptomyces sp. NPDC048018 TaxID=3365499 RepID=UPI00371455C0
MSSTVVRTARDALGAVEVIVHNAGIMDSLSAGSSAVAHRRRGIRTNAVAPGATITGIRLDAGPAAACPPALGACLGHVGQPADAETRAAAIVFLASDAASNINGGVLPVDGGWSAV